MSDDNFEHELGADQPLEMEGTTSVGKEEIHKYMQYEVSMPVHMGRVANQGKVQKWLPFENYQSESSNI